MLETIEATIAAELRGWPRPNCYYLALSGGQDSCVLLDILAQKNLRRRLNLLHINHGLQPEADAWEQHCRELAAAYQMDFFSYRAHIEDSAGWGLEMAARKARLAIWEQYLPEGSMLLQAHHQRDQAETTLQNIMRSGRALGMPAFATRTGYSVGRPMLSVPYHQVVAYAQARALSWVEDPSNDDTSFTRNHIRHEVLPPLSSRWPQAHKQLAELGARDQRQATLQREAMQALLAELSDTGRVLRRSRIERFAAELRQNLLKTFITNNDLPAATYKQLREFDRQLFVARAPRALLQLGAGGLRAYRDEISAQSPQSSSSSLRAARGVAGPEAQASVTD